MSRVILIWAVVAIVTAVFVWAAPSLTVSISPSSPGDDDDLTTGFSGSYTNVSYRWDTDNGTTKFFCTFNGQSDDCGDYYNFTSWNNVGYAIDDKGTYGLYMDSASDYIDGESHPTAFADVSFTFLMTVYHDEADYDQYYYKKGLTAAPWVWTYVRCDNQGGSGCIPSFRTGKSDGTTDELDATTQIVAGQWYTLAFVKCGEYKAIYINGILNNSYTVSGHGVPSTQLGDMQIGNSNGNNELNGTIGEFSYTDRCMTGEEIAEWSADTGIFPYESTVLGMNVTLTAKADDGTDFTSFESDTVTITEGNSCTCPGDGENWQIDQSDSCIIVDGCDIGTGILNFTGTGDVAIFNASINVSSIYVASGQKLIVRDLPGSQLRITGD